MKLVLLTAALFAVGLPVAGGTEVILDQATPDIFPESWRGSPIHAEAELLPKDQREPLKALIQKALAAYPARVLKAHLEKVYVLGQIRYSGVVAGGTNSRTAVYVVSNERYSEARFVGNFHAEFSSILLRNHPEYLDVAAWEAQNPEGFAYLGSGVQAVKESQFSLHLKDELHEQGFLHQYAQASVQEDFNAIAARLWTGDRGLWRAVERFPRIKAKTDLAIAFYTQLHPRLTFDFFHALPRTEIR